ncbi:MAG: PadR family transcriptional regulator [Nocardioides sp.]
MALEHALLVALAEHPASGYELARRFDRSIGFFWNATHQQIYRVLARMEADAWVVAAEEPQEGKPTRRTYAIAPAGSEELGRWLAEPSEREPLRSELAVKLRGASYGDRAALIETVSVVLADHRVRLAHYLQLAQRDYPDPAVLRDGDLDRYLVLRGGIGLERFWIDWLSEWLRAWGQPVSHDSTGRLSPGRSSSSATPVVHAQKAGR